MQYSPTTGFVNNKELTMSKMFNPPHPGETLREDVLPALGLSVTQAAAELGVNRVTLSRILNEKAGISVDFALRLEAWLDGPSAEVWLKGQLAYDLWQAKQQAKPMTITRHAALAA